MNRMELSCVKDSNRNFVGDVRIVPEEWTHATVGELGYLSQAWGQKGYYYYYKVVNVDASMIDSDKFDEGKLSFAVRRLYHAVDLSNADRGDYLRNREKCEKLTSLFRDYSLDEYHLKVLQPKPGVKDVCRPSSVRYSCDFVRLCVSPGVSSQYDLAKSKQFKYAGCKADDRIVPAAETESSAHDVGFAAGALILGPRYMKSVELDLPNIFGGDVDEAIQRLLMVPIQPHDLMEWDQGYLDGQAKFSQFLQNVEKKSEDSH